MHDVIKNVHDEYRSSPEQSPALRVRAQGEGSI